MKNISLALCCALLLCSCGKRIAKIETVDIVPLPASVQVSDGVFDLKKSTRICLLSDDSMLNYSVNLLNGLLDKSFGKPLAAVRADEPQAGAINIRLSDLAPEEYTLSVKPEGIDIAAGGPAGAFYAVETLRQLLPVAVARGERAGVIELPAVEIADKPFFAYRGGMLDVGRHFFDVDEVKTFIDILAMHKLNRFHWHLTEDQGWRIEIKKYPELMNTGAFRPCCSLAPDAQQPDSVPYGGYFTQDQVRDIVRYAGERFITVIPEIELPGHASAALASYQQLGCKGEGYGVENIWGVKENVYCAGKESTFEFLEDVLSEVVELFPSEYIHIGGDECPKTRWKECPYCQKRIREEKLKDEHELQSYFVQRMEKFLAGKGRRIIGWDEILEGGLSETATVMSWRGTEGGIAAAKMGNQVIMTPTTHCYLDYYPTKNTENEPQGIGGYLPARQVYSLDPYAGLNADEQKYILGVQGNLWTEFISEPDHAHYMLLPRLAAISEVGWSYDNEDRNYDDFKKRMTTLAERYDAAGYAFGKHMWTEDDAAQTAAQQQ